MSVTFAGGRKGWATTIQCQLCKKYEHEHESHFAYLSAEKPGVWEFASLRDADIEVLMARIEAEEAAKASGTELGPGWGGEGEMSTQVGAKGSSPSMLQVLWIEGAQQWACLRQDGRWCLCRAGSSKQPVQKALQQNNEEVRQVTKLWETFWAVWKGHLARKKHRNYV